MIKLKNNTDKEIRISLLDAFSITVPAGRECFVPDCRREVCIEHGLTEIKGRKAAVKKLSTEV